MHLYNEHFMLSYHSLNIKLSPIWHWVPPRFSLKWVNIQCECTIIINIYNNMFKMMYNVMCTMKKCILLTDGKPFHQQAQGLQSPLFTLYPILQTKLWVMLTADAVILSYSYEQMGSVDFCTSPPSSQIQTMCLPALLVRTMMVFFFVK
jgi:hypothetical protein